jgi:hypothetical protein
MSGTVKYVELSLIDDGTLDTVFMAYCPACGDEWEERLNSESDWT